MKLDKDITVKELKKQYANKTNLRIWEDYGEPIEEAKLYPVYFSKYALMYVNEIIEYKDKIIFKV